MKNFNSRTLAFLMPALMIADLGRCKRYSADDLDRMADDDLSHFGGSTPYFGQSDDMLDFAGAAGSFADPISKGKIFTITLTNTAVAARTALICPGLVENPTGLIKDGAFNDIAGAAGLSGAGSPGLIADLNAFIQKFPSLIAGFKISCSDAQQFEQNLILQKISPFQTHTSKNINVSIHANEANPNTKLITVAEPFFLDAQTKLSYQILPGASVSLGLIFATSLNTSQALRNKTAKAKKTIVSMGGAQNFIG
jgi:hypothetical protein